MDTNSDPNAPKLPEVTGKSMAEKAVTEQPRSAAVAAAEKVKDRLIKQPGNETIQNIIPERTLRLGDSTSAVTRSLTQDLAKTSTRSRINKLLGEGSSQILPTSSTMDKIQSAATADAKYDSTASKILGGASDKIAKTSAAATLGMYQFQRTTTLAYMSKNLSNALKHTAVAIDTYTLMRAGFTMMERKMNALIVNTAAPDAVKRTIYDIIRETLVREATSGVSKWAVGKYRTHLDPLITKYVTDPARQKAKDYFNDEKSLGGRAKKKAISYRDDAVKKIKKHAGVAEDQELTGDVLWAYARDKTQEGKKAAIDYAKRRGVAGIAADALTGRPAQNLAIRGINAANSKLRERNLANDKDAIVNGLTDSLSSLLNKSGLKDITLDDVKNVLLGTDIRTQGLSGILSPNGDPTLDIMDKKTRTRLKRKAMVKAGRAAQRAGALRTDLSNVSRDDISNLISSQTDALRDALLDPKKRRRMRRMATVRAGRAAQRAGALRDSASNSILDNMPEALRDRIPEDLLGAGSEALQNMLQLDPKKIRRMKRKARVRAGRMGQQASAFGVSLQDNVSNLSRDQISTTLTSQLDRIQDGTREATERLTGKLTKTLEAYDIPQLEGIIKLIKRNPDALNDASVLQQMMDTIRSTQTVNQAEQLLNNIANTIKDSGVGKSISGNKKVQDAFNRIQGIPGMVTGYLDERSDVLSDMLVNRVRGQDNQSVANDNAPSMGAANHNGTFIPNQSDTSPQEAKLTFGGLKDLASKKFQELKTQGTTALGDAWERTKATANNLGESTEEYRQQAGEKAEQLKNTGSAIIEGMAEAFRSLSDRAKSAQDAGNRSGVGGGGNNRRDRSSGMGGDAVNWLKKIYESINRYGPEHTTGLNKIIEILPFLANMGGGNGNNKRLPGLFRGSWWTAKQAGKAGMGLANLGLKGMMVPFKGASMLAETLLKRRGNDGWSLGGAAMRGLGGAAAYGADKLYDATKFGLGKAADIYGNTIRGAGSAVGGIASGLGTVAGRLLDPRNVGSALGAAGRIVGGALKGGGLLGQGMGYVAGKAMGAAGWVGKKLFKAGKRALGIRDNSDANETHGVSRRIDDLIDVLMPVSKYFKRKYAEEFPDAGSFKDIMRQNANRLSALRERISGSKIGGSVLGGLGGIASMFGFNKNRGRNADPSDDNDGSDDSSFLESAAGAAAGGAVMSRFAKAKAFVGGGIGKAGRLIGGGLRYAKRFGKLGKIATLAAAGLGAYGMLGSGEASASESGTDASPRTPAAPSGVPNVRQTAPTNADGSYNTPEGNNPLMAGLGTGAMAGGSKVLGRVLTKEGATVAAKGVGKSLLKKIPGVGLVVGAGLAASRAMKGDYIGAAGEFASGLASTIPVYGTAVSMGIDVWLATRDDPLMEMGIYKALGIRQADTSDDVTNTIYKLVETPVTGSSNDYNESMVNAICAAFKFPEDKSVHQFVSTWYNSVAKPVTETMRKFASQFGKVNNYDPESYTTRIGRSLFQDIEKDSKTSDSLTEFMKTLQKNAENNNDPIIKMIMDKGFSVNTYYKWIEKTKKENEIATSLASTMSTAGVTATSDKTVDGGTAVSTSGGTAASVTPVTGSAPARSESSGGMMSNISNWMSDKASDVKVGYESAKAYAADVYDAAKSKVTGQQMSAGNRFSSAAAPAWSGLGSLSQQFESSSDVKKASGMVGYDSTGGTSYGRYQIASAGGAKSTFNEFLSYLESEGGDNGKRIAEILRNAGDPNTGSAKGAVPSAWQKIANSDMGLSELEHKFIMKTHYDEQYKKLPKDMQDIVAKSRTMQDVLASTSVQHRNHTPGIFIKTFPKDGDLATWISNIYEERKTRFKSSTPQVQQAVVNRFNKEGPLALAMLKQDQAGSGGNSGGTSPNDSVSASSGTGGTSSGSTTMSESAATGGGGSSGTSSGMSAVGVSAATGGDGVSSGAAAIGASSSSGDGASNTNTSTSTSGETAASVTPTINVASPEMPTKELNQLNNISTDQLSQLIMLNDTLKQFLATTTQNNNTSTTSTNKESVLYTAPKPPVTYSTQATGISLSRKG